MNTPQQEQIIAAVRDGKTVGCNAVAGSGKTTTGRNAEATLDPASRRLNCAFSKRIALEFDKKMPKGSDNRTFNSLGHSGVRALVGKVTMRVNYAGREKSYAIQDEMGIDRDTYPDLGRAVGLAKNLGLVPSNQFGGNTLIEDTDEVWSQMFSLYDIDHGRMEEDEAISIARNALVLSINQAFNSGVIDYDDQLYIPTLWGAPIDPYDFIFVDEAQDLSPIQHKMVKRLCRGGKAQVLMAGDRNQAIYAFRGAMHDSFDTLQKDLQAHDLPLTVSFRCAKEVVREAQQYVPEIEFHEDSPEGQVVHHDDWGPEVFSTGDTILCRNTKPLIPVFYNLIANGVGAKILGSDIGKGLKTKLQKILKASGQYNLGSAQMAQLVYEWGEAEYRKRILKDEAKANQMKEQADILIAILERHPTARAAIEAIGLMFSDDIGPVTLSTIHKAKGLEWPRVWFLDSWLIPSTFATEPWQLQQERNLAYVGITRAMQELHYINTRR